MNRENPFLKEAIEQVEKNVVKNIKPQQNRPKAILQAFDPETEKF